VRDSDHTDLRSVDDAYSDDLNCYMAAPMMLIIRTKKVDSGYDWHDPLAWWKNKFPTISFQLGWPWFT
jgi:hypothetical protein